MEIFTIGDVIELDPPLFIVFTGFALGAILGPTHEPAPTRDGDHEKHRPAH